MMRDRLSFGFTLKYKEGLVLTSLHIKKEKLALDMIITLMYNIYSHILITVQLSVNFTRYSHIWSTYQLSFSFTQPEVLDARPRIHIKSSTSLATDGLITSVLNKCMKLSL